MHISIPAKVFRCYASRCEYDCNPHPICRTTKEKINNNCLKNASAVLPASIYIYHHMHIVITHNIMYVSVCVYIYIHTDNTDYEPVEDPYSFGHDHQRSNWKIHPWFEHSTCFWSLWWEFWCAGNLSRHTSDDAMDEMRSKRDREDWGPNKASCF